MPSQQPAQQPEWLALLIGGASGVGKTEAARALGLRFGVPWLQVDDLRLALQRSRAVLLEGTDALYYFLQDDVWQQPPERLRDALIAVGEAMSPALEVVIENHVDTASPVILEGDGILPSLLARPPVRERMAGGFVRAVFLVEPDEAALYANSVARSRGIAGRSGASLRTEARAKWLFGEWLAGEARRSGLPVLAPRPWDTLADRIAAATS